MQTRIRRILILVLMVSTISVNIYGIEDDDIPENNTQESVNSFSQDGGGLNQSDGNSNNTTTNGSSVKNETMNLADDLESSGNSFLDSMDNVFKDMQTADDGQVFSNVSKAMAKPVAAVSQIIRALFIGIIMLLTVPDFLTLLIPALEGFFSGKSRSGGQMGGSSSGRTGLLSADYYAVAGGGGSTGGTTEGGMGGNKKGNRIIEYTKMRLITTVSAVVAMLLLMTPFGFAGIVYVVRICITALAHLFRMGAGGF